MLFIIKNLEDEQDSSKGWQRAQSRELDLGLRRCHGGKMVSESWQPLGYVCAFSAFLVYLHRDMVLHVDRPYETDADTRENACFTLSG